MYFLGCSQSSSECYSILGEPVPVPTIEESRESLTVKILGRHDIREVVTTLIFDERHIVPKKLILTMNVDDITDLPISARNDKASIPFEQALNSKAGAWISCGPPGYKENLKKGSKVLPSRANTEALGRWMYFISPIDSNNPLIFFGIKNNKKLPTIRISAYNSQNISLLKSELFSNGHWNHLDIPNKNSMKIEFGSINVKKIIIETSTEDAGIIGDISPFYIELRAEIL